MCVTDFVSSTHPPPSNCREHTLNICRPWALGDTDPFVCVKEGNGKWGRGNESFPMQHALLAQRRAVGSGGDLEGGPAGVRSRPARSCPGRRAGPTRGWAPARGPAPEEDQRGDGQGWEGVCGRIGAEGQGPRIGGACDGLGARPGKQPGWLVLGHSE